MAEATAMRGEDKRQLIMRAAESLFTNRRFHEVRMDDVAREARVAKGTLYNHFKDKDDLFFHTSTAGFDELCDLIERSAPSSDSFADQLLTVCRQTALFFEGRRRLLSLMPSVGGGGAFSSDSLHGRWVRKRRRLVETVATILARGVATGEVRSDVPPDALASILLGMLRTRAREFEAAPPHVRSDAQLVDLFLRGATGAGRMGKESRLEGK
jgi:AcrR family transcriptional regulator